MRSWRIASRNGSDSMSPTVPPIHQRHVEAAGGLVDAVLDLVGDVRDDLHGGAQVVAAALLADHRFVDLARGDGVLAREAGMDEALVVAQVQVGLGAVVGHIDLAVLEGTHGARIHVDVRIELHHGDRKATRFQNGSQRRRGDALAKRGHHSAGDENQGGHGMQPCWKFVF